MLYNTRKDLFEIQTFSDFCHELCSLMEKYVDLLRRYLSWRYEEAKKELWEARGMIRDHLSYVDVNPLQYISVDGNYVGAHPNFDPHKNKNVPETASRHNR